MKQIIVNVKGLTIEEKRRVGVALATIKSIKVSNPMYWDTFDSMYGPSCDGVSVGYGCHKSENPTHTPKQVLAMAGMVPASEQIALADTLVITDSTGNIIYDSTLGDRVKLNKNGAAVMVEKRKVRKDFDAGKEYSVNVEGCTEVEKKEVQQAFFDAGFPWRVGGKEYRCLDAVQYSNTLVGSGETTHLLYSETTDGCNMTAKEFLELVYEPEQVGHPHAELMAQYAEDAKTHAEPWKLWQLQCTGDEWQGLADNPTWASGLKYRRKPKTHIVNGVEVPDLRVKDFGAGNTLVGYCPDPLDEKLHAEYYSRGPETTNRFLELGILYEYTEEGRQAAILHSKAMLGIV